MVHPSTLSRMAELKRQDTQRGLAPRHGAADSQNEALSLVARLARSLHSIAQRLTARVTTDPTTSAPLG
jgi:hypothetical protein